LWRLSRILERLTAPSCFDSSSILDAEHCPRQRLLADRNSVANAGLRRYICRKNCRPTITTGRNQSAQYSRRIDACFAALNSQRFNKVSPVRDFALCALVKLASDRDATKTDMMMASNA